jgi:hypothetical protein
MDAVLRAVAREMKSSFPNIRSHFRIIDFMGKTLKQQVEYLASVDILLSPHGAQLSGIPFLPDCAGVLELFPTGYLWPRYFGSLAAVSGVSHSYMYLGSGGPPGSKARQQEIDEGMNTSQSRTQARAASLCPHPGALARSVVVIVREWQACCREQHHEGQALLPRQGK